MESHLFFRQWSRRRMEANGLGIILFQYADWLAKQGYSRNTIHQYTQAVEHFGFWREGRSRLPDQVALAETRKFLTTHLPSCHCPTPAVTTYKTCRAALHRLMAMLGGEVSSPKTEEAPSPAGVLISDFDRYLGKVFGLSAATRCYRRRYAREFLAWRFKGGQLDPAKLCFADFVRYVNFRTPSLQRTSVAVMITSLRSLTRFLEFEERCPAGLSQAWPTVPSWKQSPPSNVLTWKESRHLLRTVQRTSTSSLRDEAIFRLMIELGLRCSEVAELDLADIDWRAGTLAVRKNKQRRERLLPLPPSIGEAISKYLINERPASSSGRLFVCRRYLVGQPMTPQRVRGPVCRAMQRNGLVRGGPHRLRHTFATRLHERGASLKEVADILGHQDLNTTAIYARVNLVQLRQVALPWPGGLG